MCSTLSMCHCIRRPSSLTILTYLVKRSGEPITEGCSSMSAARLMLETGVCNSCVILYMKSIWLCEESLETVERHPMMAITRMESSKPAAKAPE